MAQDLIQRLKENTNEFWREYGWILIIPNLIITVFFLYMVLKKRSK